jgi:CxxC motif-containing protein
MKKRVLTCIVCPRGCEITAMLSDSGEPLSSSGFACKRGKEYAYTECTNPKRTVTSTVRCSDGSLVSVKTSSPIPKELVMECMKVINNVVCAEDVNIGEVVLENILDTGSDLVVTGRKTKMF